MRRSALCLLAAPFLAACPGDSTGGGSVASVQVTPSTIDFAALGETLVIRAQPLNDNGRPVAAAITWSSGSPVAEVESLGGDSARVRAVGAGEAVITARAGTVSGTTTVRTVQSPASVETLSGNGQTGPVATPLPAPIRVRVLDAGGAPIAGARVYFRALDGSMDHDTVTAGADGVASAIWTLGSEARQQSISAHAIGLNPWAVLYAIATPGPAAQIAVATGGLQTGGTGLPLAVTTAARVTDAHGNGVQGETVTFTASDGGSVAVASVVSDQQGFARGGIWTLGATVGTQTLTAAVNGRTLPAAVFSANALRNLTGGSIIRGNDRYVADMTGTSVSDLPTVTIRDAGGAPAAGVTVRFTVLTGQGTATGTTVITDASGTARVGSWTLGAGPNELHAEVRAWGLSSTIFRRLGCTGGGGSGYAITLCFTTTLDPPQRAVFEAAAARWRALITSDLPNAGTGIPAGSCGAETPEVQLDIDDLLIFASVGEIDGPGGILGGAGWCYRRQDGLPILGIMEFDISDFARLDAINQLSAVILHEMGHVIGIGTMWQDHLQEPTPSGGPVLDTYYSGANGRAGFDAIGGLTYTLGRKVPVENSGGRGTRNAHWREAVLGNELMTGYIDTGSNPLSQLTVRSLIDLGYTVDVAGADPYFLTLTVREGDSAGQIQLGDDIYRGPRYTIDRAGRRSRIP